MHLYGLITPGYLSKTLMKCSSTNSRVQSALTVSANNEDMYFSLQKTENRFRNVAIV